MDVALAILLALAGGAVGGLLGVGGGILFVPALAILLGNDQLEAEATSLLVIVPMAIVGTWRQHRHGNVDLRDGIDDRRCSPFPASSSASSSPTRCPQRALELGFAALCLIVAARLLKRGLAEPDDRDRGRRYGRRVSDGIDIGHGIAIPVEEIELRASRSGGPGGQHANKTASRIEATFDVRASTVAQPTPRRPGSPAASAPASPRSRRTPAARPATARSRSSACGSRLAGAAAPRKHRRATKPGPGGEGAAAGRRSDGSRSASGRGGAGDRRRVRARGATGGYRVLDGKLVHCGRIASAW